MGPSVHDGPTVQNKYPVGPNHRRKPVSNHQGGPPRHEMIQRVLNQGLALGIQTGGRLIQNQDRRFPQHDPCDGDSLALAGAEGHAPLPDDLLIAVREPRDELMGVGHPGRFPNLQIGRAEPAVGQVLSHRSGEEHGLLGNDSDVASKLPEPEAPDIHSIQTHLSGFHVVEAEDEGRHSALPRSGAAHQRNPLPLTDLKVDPVKNEGELGPVSKGNAFIGDPTANRTGEDGRCFRCPHLRRILDELEDPLCCASGLLEIPPEAGQGHDGPGDGDGVEQEGHQGPRAEGAFQYQPATLPQHQDDGSERRKGDGPREPRSGYRPPETLVPDRIHLVPEPILLPTLTSERLDDLDLTEDLFSPGYGLCQAVLNARAKSPNPSTQEPAHQGYKGNRDQGGQGEMRVGHRHKNERPDQEHALAHQFGKAESEDTLNQPRVR